MNIKFYKGFAFVPAWDKTYLVYTYDRIYGLLDKYKGNSANLKEAKTFVDNLSA